MKDIYSQILSHIDTLEIIDTHEHLPGREEDRDMDADVLQEYLSHYFNRDLISAGLPAGDYDSIIEKDMPIGDRWKLVEPYWETCRYTGYGRALDISVRDIYGIKKIDGSTIEELDKRFKKARQAGHFKKILKDKCRIRTSLLDTGTLDTEYDPREERSIHCDREYYSPVYNIKDIVYPMFWSQISRVEKQSGVRITSFTRWLEAAEALIEKAYCLGAAALKNALAYYRTLRYERVKRSQAEEDFNRIFNTKHIPDWDDRPAPAGKAFQDYMFHYILDMANKKKLIVQIHTGIQEGSGNILSHSNPELLSNLFLEYPDVTFDIFHMGYPYQDQLTVLAKNFNHVFIDMCWAHIVSPNASVNALLEWFDTVPLNKISAFGGDFLFVDGVYGHLKLARQDVAKALSIVVHEGLFDIEKAKEVAGMLFHDNPKNIFRL